MVVADSFNLVDVVKALRKDLSKAMEYANGEDIRFNVNEIEIELKAVIEEEKNGEGGFDFKIVKFGGGFKDRNIEAQTIKLKLEPIDKKNTDGSNKTQITGKAERIS